MSSGAHVIHPAIGGVICLLIVPGTLVFGYLIFGAG